MTWPTSRPHYSFPLWLNFATSHTHIPLPFLALFSPLPAYSTTSDYPSIFVGYVSTRDAVVHPRAPACPFFPVWLRHFTGRGTLTRGLCLQACVWAVPRCRVQCGSGGLERRDRSSARSNAVGRSCLTDVGCAAHIASLCSSPSPRTLRRGHKHSWERDPCPVLHPSFAARSSPSHTGIPPWTQAAPHIHYEQRGLAWRAPAARLVWPSRAYALHAFHRFTRS